MKKINKIELLETTNAQYNCFRIETIVGPWDAKDDQLSIVTEKHGIFSMLGWLMYIVLPIKWEGIKL